MPYKIRRKGSGEVYMEKVNLRRVTTQTALLSLYVDGQKKYKTSNHKKRYLSDGKIKMTETVRFALGLKILTILFNM